ncbi:DUF5695 domain-containing protein [Mucilaginibacter sp. X5P1]|uniref:DUF5695 domain-containing protein n=1 Tax=Mucilaginibacter sp. X5P1 TaxID=2723088 RepID=UPI0016086EC3|nr:DUF5695 domain-containing protein [Mucilaginibacter sp. X5P1]MBB6138725.1 hypothetical protein [Mucilaginibacter sp. X5P1]
MRIQRNFVAGVILFVCFISGGQAAMAQDPWKALETRPSTLGLEDGFLTFKTGALQLQLVKSSQTVAALNPVSDTQFDFTPHDRLKLRSSDHMYQLGDIDLRLRVEGETEWTKYSTSTKRAPVRILTINDDKVLAAADLSATLPSGIPLNVQRYYELIDGHLVLLFKLKNTSDKNVEIGSLGIPMIFNNIMQGKSLEENHAQSVFYDPYIGKDAGYLQVTRLNGHGPALVVVPYGKTPFEAYSPLLDDPTPRGIDFEGFYEWMVHSKAYAENEWKKAEPWNTPTSFTLKPGETTEYGVKFLLADSIKGIESTLIANKRPVAVGVPGYVLPMSTKARLFLNYGEKVKSLQVEPEGALTLSETAAVNDKWKAYQIEGKIWGRARLTITYEDGLSQTINYKVIKAEGDMLKDFGHFLTNEQWYVNKNDPFHRDQSVISYDYETKKQVTQDSRVWISGLSDEGGAGSWLGAMMKELIQPDKAEIDKLQHFVNHTLWGVIQHDEGKQKYGVKKSVYYYEPKEMPAGTYSDSVNHKTWTAWNHEAANDVGRSYNYPHVAAAWWVMYRLSRNHVGLVTEQNWQWYLDHAYQTTMAMINQAPYYVQFGQMEGTVFYLILMDLKAEGWNDKAAIFEKAIKERADHWNTLQYPFGSEMPWDSTGQEEVYLWSSYFGYTNKAEVTIDAILGYMPTVPNWGYNGSARRYWDFLYGGKLSRIERQLHHYGSGINAIPVLAEYRKKPSDLYLLRVGYGGVMGSVSNITQDGFGPAAFHSFPSTLKIDGLSGDYGPNFFGYAVNISTYIMHDDNLGWLAFGGNLVQKDNWIDVKITNGAKSRVFIAAAGLWLTLDAGTFNTVSYNTTTGAVSVLLDAADKYTPSARLHIKQTANVIGAGTYSLGTAKIRGAYVIALKNSEVKVNLTHHK